MDLDSGLIPTLTFFLPRLPVFVAWIVGVIIAIVLWRRHPRVSLLTVIALALLFLEAAVGGFLSLWLNLQLGMDRMAPSQVGILLALLDMLRGAIAVVAWGFLLAAIFGWRGRQSAMEAVNS